MAAIIRSFRKLHIHQSLSCILDNFICIIVIKNRYLYVVNYPVCVAVVLTYQVHISYVALQLLLITPQYIWFPITAL